MSEEKTISAEPMDTWDEPTEDTELSVQVMSEDNQRVHIMPYRGYPTEDLIALAREHGLVPEDYENVNRWTIMVWLFARRIAGDGSSFDE